MSMNKIDEYRLNAQECERMAATSRRDDDRVTWLLMAAHWLRMIPQPNLTDLDAFDRKEAAQGTHQKRSDTEH
jgi:hypothetical protein